jgi:tetratricopeptide (TPR) repeat protein
MRHCQVFRRPAGFILLAVLLLSGCCTMGGTVPKLDLPPSAPSGVMLTNVPFYAQSKHHCGPAALAMALQWSGVAATPEKISDMVFTPGREGSFQSDLITATRRSGRLAYPIKGLECLIQEIAAGTPVVVLQNLGLKFIPRWHYATVIGYDLDQPSITLHTGSKPARRVGLRTFMATWNRADQWGLLVLPADRMPRCARQTAYLKSAYGLQIAGFTGAAILAFQQAVATWPESAQAHMALGNAYYRDGDPQKAIQSYSRAVQIEPRNGDALNNLAYMLAETGDLKAAAEMAGRAVDVAGPRLETYRKTLQEIKRKLGK